VLRVGLDKKNFVHHGQEVLNLGFVTLRGRPKYVKGKVPFAQPKVLAKCSNLSSETLIDTIMDFFEINFQSC